MVRAVYTIVARLSVDLRITFTLRYLERLSVDEIAELTRTSSGTVKRRLVRAQEIFTRHAAQHPALAALASDRRGGDDR